MEMDEIQEQSQPQSSEKQDISQESDTGNDKTINGEEITSENAEVEEDDMLPPKVNTEVEVLHDKVTKQIIKEGSGNKPSRNSTCFLHYRAWAESTMHKFQDTWQEQQPLELVLGRG